MRQIYLLFSFISVLFFYACNDDDLSADIPSYLSIDDVSVSTTAAQGSASDRITDVTVFINDQSLGFFELPARVPIRTTGQVNLKIRPVIQKNGMSSQKVDYPFYTTYNVDTFLIPENEFYINPVVEYFPTTNFTEPWSGEDFESGINFEYDPQSDTSFVRTLDPNDAFEGASGIAVLESNQRFFEARTPTFSNIPRNGTAVYMELNFKSTHDIAISVYANNQSVQQAVIFLRGRSTWSKVYIELGSVFATLASSQNFNIAISTEKPIGETSRLVVDNVKLLRF